MVGAMQGQKWFRISVAVTTALVLGACGASAPPKRKPAAVEPAAGGAYDFRSEGRIPPATAGEARVEPDVEEMAVSDSGLEVSEAEAPPDTAPRVAAPADSVADGFRIQVFASQDREVAETSRLAAADRLGVPAYMDLEGGMYKVRVGDYATRADADAALATLRKHYYPDAWVVAARIRVPRAR